MSNISTLQQLAATVAHNPIAGGPVRISRVTANHWPNPTADFTVFLSSGTSHTLLNCSLILVGTSTTDAAFKAWIDSPPRTIEQLSALVTKDVTAETRFCCALKYDSMFVLLANLDVERNCIGRLNQERIKIAYGKQFGDDMSFLDFVYKKHSPLIIAVISQFYALTNNPTKPSQSRTEYMRAVDENGGLSAFDGEKKSTATSASTAKAPKSLSSGARLLANLAKVKEVTTTNADGTTSTTTVSAGIASSATQATKKPRRKRQPKQPLKPTKVISTDECDDDDVDVVVLASSDDATHVRRLTAEQIAERDRIATMFAGFETTNRVRVPIYLSVAELLSMVTMFKGVLTKPNIYDFPLLNDISVSKNNWIEFPHQWLGAAEAVVNDDACASRVGNVVTWIVRRIIGQQEPTVPECLIALSTRQPHEIEQWDVDSPFESDNNAAVRVRHVSIGVNGEAARNIVAARALQKGVQILDCAFARQMQRDDLLGINIGLRVCGVDRALAVPTNITCMTNGDAPVYLMFNALSPCIEAGDALLFVGDTRGEPNARVQFNAATNSASLELLRDIADGEAILINRGDAFRNEYKALTGKEFPEVTGGTESVHQQSITDMVVRMLGGYVIQVPPSSPTPTTTTTTTTTATTATSDTSNHILRQRALDILDPSKSPVLFSTADFGFASPRTPLNKKRAMPFDSTDSAKQARALLDQPCSGKLPTSLSFDDTDLEALRAFQDGTDTSIAEMFGYTQ